MEINLNGSGTPEEELTAFLRYGFSRALSEAINDVGADMQDSLARHIETDVYAKYPNPSMYERRKMDGGLVAQAMKAKIYNGGNRIAIEYKPDGMHPTVAGWHKVDADDLVGRIEKHSPEYNWLPKKRKIPNRPFWQKFVDEMVNDGMAEYFLANALRRRDFDVVEDGDVVREPTDGAY